MFLERSGITRRVAISGEPVRNCPSLLAENGTQGKISEGEIVTIAYKKTKKSLRTATSMGEHGMGIGEVIRSLVFITQPLSLQHIPV